MNNSLIIVGMIVIFIMTGVFFGFGFTGMSTKSMVINPETGVIFVVIGTVLAVLMGMLFLKTVRTEKFKSNTKQAMNYGNKGSRKRKEQA